MAGSPESSSFAGGLDLEDVPCPMACPRDDVELFVGRDRLHGLPGAFPVVRCRGCGLMRTTPRPTLDKIGAYYPDRYGPYQPSARPAPAAAPAAAGAASMLRRWARRLGLDGTGGFVPGHLPAGRALEVGCASGELLARLRLRGWEVRGIEPSASAARRAHDKGLAVHVGPIETAPDPEQRLDLVVASHTLEHLHRPLESLRRMRSWAAPGAWLTCAVPDAGSLLFRRFGAAWYDLDLPRHLFHFTPRSLEALMAAAGWKLVRVRSQATLNSLMGSVAYRLLDRSGGAARRWGGRFAAYPDSRSPAKRLLAPPLELALKATRQSGRMLVWARAV